MENGYTRKGRERKEEVNDVNTVLIHEILKIKNNWLFKKKCTANSPVLFSNQSFAVTLRIAIH